MKSEVVFALGAMTIAGSFARGPSAQTPAGPAFEVASIKPNKAGSAAVSRVGFPGGGRFSATNATVRELIRVAYAASAPLEDSRLVGGPGWTGSDRFDVVAKAATDAGPQQLLLMLRTLLAERFQLTVHNETRDLPIYLLVMAAPDGQPGPQLHPSEDCTALPRRREGSVATGAAATICGGRGSPGRLAFGGMPLSTLVSSTAFLREVQRPVVDRTGLTGFFDGSLEWTPGDAPILAFGGPPPDAPPAPTDGPSIFAALQEQFGLKLEPGRGPVDVLVVDRVERLKPE